VGAGLGNFQKQIPAQQKLRGKKSCKQSHGEKHRASSLYYPGPVFDLKNILANCCPPKRIMHNLKMKKM